MSYIIAILVVILLAGFIAAAMKKREEKAATQVRDLAEIDNDTKEYLLSVGSKKID